MKYLNFFVAFKFINVLFKELETERIRGISMPKTKAIVTKQYIRKETRGSLMKLKSQRKSRWKSTFVKCEKAVLLVTLKSVISFGNFESKLDESNGFKNILECEYKGRNKENL